MLILNNGLEIGSKNLLGDIPEVFLFMIKTNNNMYEDGLDWHLKMMVSVVLSGW
jgi:hypothetical protein